MAHPSFELFREQWVAVAHSVESEAALRALANREPRIAALGLDDLGELVDVLGGDRRVLDPVAADRVLGDMVTHQALGSLLGLAVVVALTPGLKAVARRMAWGATGPWGHPEVYTGDLMTTAWEVVADWAGRRREYMAPALLGAIQKRLSRQAESWRREVSVRADMTEVADAEGSSPSDAERLARVLDDAARTMPCRDVAIVYAHRVLGLTMVELAEMTGQSRQVLDRRRARLEKRLLCA